MNGMLSRVRQWLDQKGIAYEVLEHPAAFTALDEARAAGAPPEDAAKSVLLHDEDGYRLAVIPALRRLDLERVRLLLGATKHLRLATEHEMEQDFPGLEVGALPPFGPLLAAPEVVDTRLLAHDRVVCSAGDHAHLLSLNPNDLVRAVEPLVGDICSHHPSIHDEDFAETPRF